jgi:hypothetical protein
MKHEKKYVKKIKKKKKEKKVVKKLLKSCPKVVQMLSKNCNFFFLKIMKRVGGGVEGEEGDLYFLDIFK